MKIGTKYVPEEESNTRVSSFIKPGINDNLSVTDMEERKAQTGNVGITFKFSGPAMEELEGKSQTGETTLWFGDTSIDSSIARISDMAKAAGVKDAVDAIEAPDAAAYIAAVLANVKPLLVNKPMRLKMQGVEIEGEKGNWFKAELPWKYFAESMDVSLEDTRLRFDSNSQYDMKKLPVADLDETFGDDTKEDMPF